MLQVYHIGDVDIVNSVIDIVNSVIDIVNSVIDIVNSVYIVIYIINGLYRIRYRLDNI